MLMLISLNVLFHYFLNIYLKECGVASISPTLAESYILFGNDAVNGEWPWQALLFIGSSSICGATLIDAHWAVTAAHCVE
jgi:secreted trypsin-like serine protease